jgi:hypothetical protein
MPLLDRHHDLLPCCRLAELARLLTRGLFRLCDLDTV